MGIMGIMLGDGTHGDGIVGIAFMDLIFTIVIGIHPIITAIEIDFTTEALETIEDTLLTITTEETIDSLLGEG